MGRIKDLFDSAKRAGHLIFYESEPQFKIESEYLVRYCEALWKKIQSAQNSIKCEEGKKRNPFLPPDENLFISKLNQTHSLIFNKFCVMPLHMLIISNEYIDQSSPLTKEDFMASEEALKIANEEETCDDGWMFFYNSGPNSGASQPHRHLQIIPNERPPICQAFNGDTISPFNSIIYGFERIKSKDGLSSAWFSAYQLLLKKIPTASCSSYSLLFTSSWMLLVPRSREHYQQMSLNALTFAGYFLAISPEDLKELYHTSATQIFDAIGYPSNQ